MSCTERPENASIVKTRKRCDFFRAPKIVAFFFWDDFLAIFCDFCSKIAILQCATKGGRQKGIGKKVTKNEEKVTKEWKKGYQKVAEKWVAYPLLPTPFCSTLNFALCDLKTQRFFCDCDFWGRWVPAYHWHRNQNEAKQHDFRIDCLENYENESESEIRGEVSMWTWMRKIICPINITRIWTRKRKRRNIFGEFISL